VNLERTIVFHLSILQGFHGDLGTGELVPEADSVKRNCDKTVPYKVESRLYSSSLKVAINL
jgi:hypothetical protein